MVPKLSKAAEDRLIHVVGQAAQLISEGQHPNDAIIKIASEAKLPAGHIKLVVNAVNTGRVNIQRKSSDDIWEKAATVPLANTETILEALYPSKVKSAAAKLIETAVADEYKASPTGWLKRRQSFETANVVSEGTTKQASELPKAEYGKVKKAEASRKKVARELEDARHQAGSAFYKLAEATDAVQNYFKTAQHMPFCDVRNYMVTMHGDKAEKLFDYLASKQPALIKEASRVKRVNSATATKLAGNVFDLVNKCMSLADEFEHLHTRFSKLASEQEKDMPKATEQPKHVLERFFQCEGSVKSAGPISMMGGALRRVTQPLANIALPGVQQYGDPQPVQGPQVNPSPELLAWEMSNPDHENDLRSIQVSAWLQDAMVNHPGIREHPREEVARAYNELSKLSPRVMGIPVLALTMLNKYLKTGGNVDLFDAQGGLAQVVDIENKLKTRDAYPSDIDPFSGPTLPEPTSFGGTPRRDPVDVILHRSR